MKKLFAILLCIAMMLSMVACGGNQDNSETPNNDQGNAGVSNEKPTGEPTEEEQRAIGNYVAALEALDKFAETGSWANLSFNCQDFGVAYEGDNYIIEGAAAAEKYYELISNLGAMDKWVGTEYAVGETVNWDRQSVLDSFVIYENVKLSENYSYYDPAGNTESGEIAWYYNTDGKLEQVRWDSTIGEKFHLYSFVFDPIETDPLRLMMAEYDHRAEPVFGADGKVTEVKIIGGGETMFLAKLTYGSNGKVSAAAVTDADGRKGTLTYTYNDQKQLVEVSFSGDGLTGNVYYWEENGTRGVYGSDSFTYTYTYNADGTVATKTYTGYSQWYTDPVFFAATEYSYDAAGNLSGAACKSNFNTQSSSSNDLPFLFTDTYTFTCDDQGRPVFATITSTDIVRSDSFTQPTKTPKIEVECIYGDLYVYTPAK